MRVCRYLLLFALIQPPLASAAIYQYVDGSGTPVFTNTPHRGAVRLHLPPVPVLRRRPVPVAAPMRGRPQAQGRAPAPPRLAAQLRIPPQTQRQRDRRRRQLLQSELSREERRLQDTQHRLAGPPRDPQEAAQLHTELTAHQKNIAALRQELASTR